MDYSPPLSDSRPVLSCVKTAERAGGQLRPGPETLLELDLWSEDLTDNPAAYLCDI